MKLGLISDTHDNLALVHVATDFLRAQAPDLILHLGDVTTGQSVPPFAGLPVEWLLGNNDGDPSLARALRAAGFALPHREWRATLDGVRVFALHGDDHRRLQAAAQHADVVLHGHTHKRRARRADTGALVLNPGALSRCLTKTVAILDVPAMDVRWFEVRADGVTPAAPQ